MTPEQAAAFVAAQAAAMLVELEGMKVANIMRERAGHSPAYGEDAFDSLIGRYPAATHNGAMEIFSEANRS